MLVWNRINSRHYYHCKRIEAQTLGYSGNPSHWRWRYFISLCSFLDYSFLFDKVTKPCSCTHLPVINKLLLFSIPTYTCLFSKSSFSYYSYYCQKVGARISQSWYYNMVHVYLKWANCTHSLARSMTQRSTEHHIYIQTTWWPYPLDFWSSFSSHEYGWYVLYISYDTVVARVHCWRSSRSEFCTRFEYGLMKSTNSVRR